MGIIEGKIGNPADAAELLIPVACPVGFTDILDQRDSAPLQFADQQIGQPVKTLHMGDKHRTSPVGDFGQDMRCIHRQTVRINIGKHRGKPVLDHRGNIGHPGQRWHNHLAAVRMTQLEQSHRQQIG